MKKFRTEKIIIFKTKNLQKTNLNKPLTKAKEISVNKIIRFKKNYFRQNLLPKK